MVNEVSAVVVTETIFLEGVFEVLERSRVCDSIDSDIRSSQNETHLLDEALVDETDWEGIGCDIGPDLYSDDRDGSLRAIYPSLVNLTVP